MVFNRMGYLDFVKREDVSNTRYNLSHSNILPLSQEELGLKLEDLDFGMKYAGIVDELIRWVSIEFKIPTDNVFIGAGSSSINKIIFETLLEEGDEVLIEDPVYPPLLINALEANAKIRRFIRTFENNYQVDTMFSEITNKTKLIVMTNLHNPSSAYTDESYFETLIRILETNNTYLLCDEVYSGFIDDHVPAHLLSNKIISVNSLTKFYGMGGLRVGWALCEPKLVNNLLEVYDHFVDLSSVSVKIAVESLKKLDCIRKRNKEIINGNYKLLKEFINSRSDLECVMFDDIKGIVYFPKTHFLDATHFVEFLIKNHDTAVAPGKYFGAKEHFRVGLGIKKEILEGSLERLALALDGYKE